MSWLTRLLGEGFVFEIWKTSNRGEYACLAYMEEGPQVRGVGPTPREATLHAVKRWKDHEDNE